MSMRRLGAAVVTLVVAAVAPALFLAPAADAASYRYWTYWTASAGSWNFAQVGPSTLRPKDGSVQGWRFAVSVDAASAAKPRIAAGGAFDEVCGGTPAEDGKKRVALVVDFGIPAHAPSGDAPPTDALRGTCVVTADRSNGWDVLVQAGYGIRSDDSGLVCGLSGYPERGCGETVKDPSPGTGGGSGSAATKPPSSTSGDAGSGSNRTRDDGSDRGRDRDSDSDAGTTTRDGSRASGSPSPTARSSDATDDAPEGSEPSPSASDAATSDPASTSEPTPTLVTGAPDTAAASSGGPGGAVVTLVGIAAVVGIGGAAFVRSRRRA